MPFDPRTQLNALQQVLVQDKTSIGFLLAAGCGVAVRNGDAPLVPNVEGLTKMVTEKVSAGEYSDKFLSIIEQFREDGKDAPNVEVILSHIRALKIVAGNSTVRGLTKDDLAKLEGQICTIIAEVVDQNLPTLKTPHHQFAKWIRSTPRSVPVEIFTTNYDLLLEQALEDCEVPYFDGFIGARRAFFDLTSIEQDHLLPRDQLPSRWARLWKLHGSINWRLVRDGDDKVFVVRSMLKNKGDSLLIHPSHMKYEQSRRMPYLAMMDRLRSFVARKQAFLIICGYSFGDDHINEAIAQGLRSNSNATAFALQYGALNDYPQAIKMAEENPNLCLLASDSAILGMKRANWFSIESEAISDTGTLGIHWIPVEGDDAKKQASLALGDFEVLGSLFAEMIGRTTSERGGDE